MSDPSQAEGTPVGDQTTELKPAQAGTSTTNFFGTLPAGVGAAAPLPEKPQAPLLRTDTAFELGESGAMEAQWRKGEEFESANRGGVLTTSDQGGVGTFNYPSDLLSQKLDANETPPIADTFAQSGSTRPGQRGGILSGDANNVMTGNGTRPPENIGNPRVGVVQELGVIPGGSSPAESEEVLRKQILEAIRTEPATRLDQTVAIPELYQQVNPVAKLGFPVMQTRPQYQEDFVRGRLSLPPSLTIDPANAYKADQDAYSHIGSLDHMKSVYAGEFGGNPPPPPGAFTKNAAKNAMNAGGAGGAPLPSFADMFPGVYDATDARNRGPAPGRNPGPPNSDVPAPKAGEMPPLMFGGTVESVPDTFSGGAPGSGASQWPIGGTGYAVDGAAMRQRDQTAVPTDRSEVGAGQYTGAAGTQAFPYEGGGGGGGGGLGQALGLTA